MKKSKINWIEYIPKNWEEKPLKSLLLESKEKNTNIKTKNILSVTKDRGVIPYEEKGQIGNNKSEDIGRYKLVKKNDLVVNKMNIVIGSLGISRYSGALSQVYLVYRPKVELDIRYYEYVFRNPKFYKYTKKYTTGIMELRESLNDLYFKNTYLPVPPMKEQMRIANFLDDKIIKINNEIINVKKQKERVLLYKKAKLSELLESEQYQFIKLKYIVTEKLQYGANESGIDYNEKLPRYIRITDIGNDGRLKKINRQSLEVEKAQNYLLQKDDILLARSGATVGKSFINKEEVTSAFAGYLIKVKINKNIIIPDLVYYYTLSSMYSGWKNNILIKSTIENISAERYENMKIPVVIKNRQKVVLEKILKTEKKINKKIELLNKKENLLEEYKNVLINDAVTGKIDIGEEYGK